MCASQGREIIGTVTTLKIACVLGEEASFRGEDYNIFTAAEYL